jgi:hypothetical protein
MASPSHCDAHQTSLTETAIIMMLVSLIPAEFIDSLEHLIVFEESFLIQLVKGTSINLLTSICPRLSGIRSRSKSSGSERVGV